MVVVDSYLSVYKWWLKNVMQTTFIQLDVPHTVIISLHILIMHDVSKLMICLCMSSIQLTLLSFVAKKSSHEVCNQVKFKQKFCAAAVVHAGSLAFYVMASSSHLHRVMMKLFDDKNSACWNTLKCIQVPVVVFVKSILHLKWSRMRFQFTPPELLLLSTDFIRGHVTFPIDSPISLQWRPNERDGVSNHQPHDCLLNPLFRHIWKKAPNLRVTGLCGGNSPMTGEFPAQKTSNAEKVSIIWWRHHVNTPKVYFTHRG